jgi:uncharacterized protein (TIGR03437 family)
MTRIRSSIIRALVLTACVGAGTARADDVAIDVTVNINPEAGSVQPFNYTQGSYISGFAFRVNTAISITHLGYYDSNLTSVVETFRDTPVGVYDLSTNTLLTSTTVHASDPANGLFRYVAITPLALSTTHTYAVVGVTGSNFYTVGVQKSTSPVNAAINYLSAASYYSSAGSPGYDTQTSTLIQPNDFSAGNVFGTPTPSTFLCDFGPNFLLTTPGAALPTITSVSNSGSGQNGIAAGTYTSIYGSNFAAAGFLDTWSNSIVGGQLPVKLDGVTVDIGGTAAYIVAVTPGQINVLTPNVGTGSMPVTVTTTAGASAPFTVTAQTVQPAFFPWPGNSVVATHLDYSYAVKNGLFPTPTVPAKPGEVIILWGTGFGPTTPAAPSGQVVAGGPYYVNGVTVTVGGIQAQGYGVALASGLAALYQVAIQVPTSLANGDYEVLAGLSGQQSATGAVLTVQQQ